jgi:outer membrane protein
MMSFKWVSAAVAACIMLAGPVAAGGNDGNFMVRLQGTYLITDDKVKSLTSGATDLRAAGFDGDVSDVFLPTATLTYFFNKNIAVELLCCFSKHHVDLKTSPANAALAGSVAETWIFPPALTLQYHFDHMGPFKPYVGVGAQYIHFFSSGTASNTVQADSVNFSDAFGVTLQAGFDWALGQGWYLNFDVKKSWLDTTATWRNSVVTADNIVAKVDLDPITISGGIGYRFNIEELFHRRSSYASMK